MGLVFDAGCCYCLIGVLVVCFVFILVFGVSVRCGDLVFIVPFWCWRWCLCWRDLRELWVLVMGCCV